MKRLFVLFVLTAPLWANGWISFEMKMCPGENATVRLVLQNNTGNELKDVILADKITGDAFLKVSVEPPYVQTIPRGESRAFTFDVWLVITPRNGEVAPDFMDFKVKEEPAEIASLVPFLLAREYEFTHTLTEHYDYYPIVFLHGNNSNTRMWFSPDDYTVLEKLLDSHYRYYRMGDATLDRDEPVGSTVHEIYPKRVIYNCEYYKPGFESGDPNPQGVIGSNGHWWPIHPYDCGLYSAHMAEGEYAEEVAEHINRILAATYSDKVHCVAHSMGGVVLRSAIVWYGCQEKVNRVLMIATPNQGCHYTAGEEKFIAGVCVPTGPICPNWMFYGELGELGVHRWVTDWPVPCIATRLENTCFNNTCGGGGECLSWIGKLNEEGCPGSVKYATIGGARNPKIAVHPSDGVIDSSWVPLDCATFNAVHYSSHSSGPSKWYEEASYGEASLTACEYVLEYIKTWVIDGDETRRGKELNIINIDYSIDPYSDFLLDIEFGDVQELHKLLSVQVVLGGKDIYGSESEKNIGASYRVGEENGRYLHYNFGHIDDIYDVSYIYIYLYTLDGIAYSLEEEW